MASSLNMDAYLARSRAAIASRPPKVQIDHLSPTNSHLLTLALADHLPPSASARPDAPTSSLPPDPHRPIPQGHHLVYFPIQAPGSALSPDGTDPDHAPGTPFVRRMWAGARVEFAPGWADALILDGRRACCVETVGEPVVKSASDASKVFVDVRRRYGLVASGRGDEAAVDALLGGRGVVMEEVRRLVFMPERPGGEGAASAPVRVVRAPSNPDFSFTLVPDAALLFQFSALTYNAHAIHLNPDYARNEEGYPERLVHGPLTLVLMLAALRSCLRQPPHSLSLSPSPAEAYVKTIDYRNLAPLFVGRQIKVCVRETSPGGGVSTPGERTWQVWIEGPGGGLAVKGSATTVTGKTASPEAPVPKL